MNQIKTLTRLFTETKRRLRFSLDYQHEIKIKFNLNEQIKIQRMLSMKTKLKCNSIFFIL